MAHGLAVGSTAMNQKPGLPLPVLRTVLYCLMIEALIVWGFFEFRGLAQAVRDAATRYGMTANTNK